jgi:hypothetical protein
MKLVEILAKELGEWPDRYNTSAISQDSNKSLNRLDRGLFAWQANMHVTDHGVWNSTTWTMFSDLQVEQLATDHATAIVTREMWQAERDKCTRIAPGDTITISGLITGHQQSVSWPFEWRDRIREIDATIEAMTYERAELVSKLAGEGFALIAVAAESVEDMSDWRDWRVGDCVEVVDDGEWMNPVGAVISITEIDHGGESNYPITAGNIYYMPGMLKFHSRPTA